MNKVLLSAYLISFHSLFSFAIEMDYLGNPPTNLEISQVSTGKTDLLSSPRVSGTDLFIEVYSIFYHQYYRELNDREFVEKLLKGGIPAFDKYCHYADPDLKKLEEEQQQGIFYGIGLTLGQEKFKGEIVLAAMSVMDNSPAARAGIQAGDYIVAIASDGVKKNAVSADDLSIQSAVQLIRGEKNTKVFLAVERKGEILEFVIARDEIKIEILYGKLAAPKVGYLRLREFQGEDMLDDFSLMVSSLQARGAKVLILDLRNNPGGFLYQAVEINNWFRSDDAGPIVIIKTRRNTESFVGDELNAGKFKELPVIVLVNKGSASASEIVAAYLKNYSKAIVIGTTTFGKGVGQSQFNLESGGRLIMTSFEYLVGKNFIKVHEIGVKPTIEVTNPKSVKSEADDMQLKRAIEEAEKLLK